MAQLQNLQTRDPFADAPGGAPVLNEVNETAPKKTEVHIRFQQRTGRKGITTVQGLNQKLNFEKLNKEFKKRWGCAGTIINDPEAGNVIQLQGDQRQHLTEFIIEEKLAKEENIRVFGL
jgi:translation initiation factor 1